MNVKSSALFIILFCCYAHAGLAQYVLQVGDQFIPIANEDEVSKKTLLSADTVRVVYLKPGANEPSPMNNVMLVTQQNGENTGAYMYPSGIFGKEVLSKIEKMDGGHLLIGQYKVSANNFNRTNKGPTVRLSLGP